jgi:hypothetical protein
VERVRALVDHTLAGLLRTGSAPAEDAEIANAFATLLTPALLAGLRERADPVWQVPVRGSLAAPTLPGAVGHLLACAGCLDAVRATADDTGLAAALGYQRLPRTLRGLHARLAGQPRPHQP